MKQAYDINPSVGGPLMRDKLWFYVSARWQDEPELRGRPLREPERRRSRPNGCRIPIRSSRACSASTQKGVNAAPHLAGRRSGTSSRSSTTTRAASGTTAAPPSRPNPRWPTASRCSTSRRRAGRRTMTSQLLFEARFGNRGEAFGNQYPEEGGIYRELDPGDRADHSLQYRGKGGDGGSSGALRLQHAEDQHAHGVGVLCHGRALLQGGLHRHVGADATARRRPTTSALLYRFTNGVPDAVHGVRAGRGRHGPQGDWRDRLLRPGPLDDQPADAQRSACATTSSSAATRSRRSARRSTSRPATTVPGGHGQQLQGHHAARRRAYDLFGNGKTALKVSLGRYVAGDDADRQSGRHHHAGQPLVERQRLPGGRSAARQLRPGLRSAEHGRQGECGAGPA